jgi:hypothetical protein
VGGLRGTVVEFAGGRVLKVTLTASTGAKIHVWREDNTFCSRLADSVTEPEICLPIDLFEVIAELAGLELDDGPRAAESVELAEYAMRVLGVHEQELADGDADSEEPPAVAR